MVLCTALSMTILCDVYILFIILSIILIKKEKNNVKTTLHEIMICLGFENYVTKYVS